MVQQVVLNSVEQVLEQEQVLELVLLGSELPQELVLLGSELPVPRLLED